MRTDCVSNAAACSNAHYHCEIDFLGKGCVEISVQFPMNPQSNHGMHPTRFSVVLNIEEARGRVMPDVRPQ